MPLFFFPLFFFLKRREGKILLIPSTYVVFRIIMSFFVVFLSFFAWNFLVFWTPGRAFLPFWLNFFVIFFFTICRFFFFFAKGTDFFYGKFSFPSYLLNLAWKSFFSFFRQKNEFKKIFLLFLRKFFYSIKILPIRFRNGAKNGSAHFFVCFCWRNKNFEILTLNNFTRLRFIS